MSTMIMDNNQTEDLLLLSLQPIMESSWSSSSRVLLATNETSSASYNETEQAQEEEDDDLYTGAGSVESMYLPRITAFISLFAVVCVFMEALLDLKQATNQRNNNIILANRNGGGCGGSGSRIRSSRAQINFSTVSHVQVFYQIPIFCYSLALFMGSNPVPKEMHVWGAVGNTATCNFQGTLLQFGTVGVFAWDAALSATYLTMARVIRTEDIQARMEFRKKLYHCLIWPILLFLTIYPLVTGLYNFGYNVCWIHEFPSGCDEIDSDDLECIRGAGASLWSTLVSLLAIVHLIYSIIVMICLYCTIRKIENRTHQHTHNSSTITETSNNTTTNNSRRYSKAVGVQGLWYASGMLMTTLPTATYVILWNAAGLWSEGFSVFALMMSPLVGYVNFCIFMRNRKVDDCHTKYGKFLRKAHSWMLDYDLFCQCKCQCIPRRWLFTNGKNNETEGQTAPTSLPPFDNNNTPAYGPGKQHYQQQQQQQQHSEGSSHGLLTGVCIKLKGDSELPFISELGTESRDQTEKDDWVDASPRVPKRIRSEVEPQMGFPGESNTTGNNNSNGGIDASPNIPRRLRSQVEHDHQPPTQPMRAPSGVEGLDHVVSNYKGGRAPAIPIRAISSILHSVIDETASFNDDEEDLPVQPAPAAPGEVGFLISAEQDRNHPRQLVSELGLSSVGEYSEAGDNNNCVDESPNMPRRLRSHVEHISPPPTKPSRAVSEVEDLDVVTDRAKIVGGRAPVKPTRAESTILQSVVEDDEEETSIAEDNSPSMLPRWLNRKKTKLSTLSNRRPAHGAGNPHQQTGKAIMGGSAPKRPVRIESTVLYNLGEEEVEEEYSL